MMVLEQRRTINIDQSLHKHSHKVTYFTMFINLCNNSKNEGAARKNAFLSENVVLVKNFDHWIKMSVETNIKLSTVGVEYFKVWE